MSCLVAEVKLGVWERCARKSTTKCNEIRPIFGVSGTTFLSLSLSYFFFFWFVFVSRSLCVGIRSWNFGVHTHFMKSKNICVVLWFK